MYSLEKFLQITNLFSICSKILNKNDSVQCKTCAKCVHTNKCSTITDQELDQISNGVPKWLCYECFQQHLPFFDVKDHELCSVHSDLAEDVTKSSNLLRTPIRPMNLLLSAMIFLENSQIICLMKFLIKFIINKLVLL